MARILSTCASNETPRSACLSVETRTYPIAFGFIFQKHWTTRKRLRTRLSTPSPERTIQTSVVGLASKRSRPANGANEKLGLHVLSYSGAGLVLTPPQPDREASRWSPGACRPPVAGCGGGAKGICRIQGRSGSKLRRVSSHPCCNYAPQLGAADSPDSTVGVLTTKVNSGDSEKQKNGSAVQVPVQFSRGVRGM